MGRRRRQFKGFFQMKNESDICPAAAITAVAGYVLIVDGYNETY